MIWSVVAAVASSGLNFLLSVSMARLLGREGFGQFGMVLSTISTVAGIAQLAMGYTTTKFVAEFRTSDPARAGRVIDLSGLVSLFTAALAAIALCASGPWLAAESLASPRLAGTLQLASLMVFFTVLVGYKLGALAGMEKFRSLALIATVGGCANVLCAVSAALALGVDGAVAGMGVGALMQWWLARRLTLAECRRERIPIVGVGRVTSALSERAVLVSFAIPAALGGLSSMPALWLANSFLVRQPDGFSQLALYTAAFSVRSLVFFLPNLVNRVSMSLLNNVKGSRDWDGYRRVFWTNAALTAGTVTVAAVGVGLVGVQVLALFGRDFRVARPVLLVLLGAAVLEAAMASLYQIMQAEARMWASLFWIALPRDLSIVALSYVLSPRLGAQGLAIGYACGWALACAMTGLLVARTESRLRSSVALAGGRA